MISGRVNILEYAQRVARAAELCIRPNDTSLPTERGVPRSIGVLERVEVTIDTQESLIIKKREGP